MPVRALLDDPAVHLSAGIALRRDSQGAYS